MDRIKKVLDDLSQLDDEMFNSVELYMEGKLNLSDIDKVYKKIRTNLKEARKIFFEGVQ